MKTLSRIWLALGAALALAVCANALAQGYPNRPIKLIVADSPGGAPDQLARLAAHAVGDTLGQPIVVENRAGAAGIPGAESVAKSPPDGYTLVVITSAVYAILPNLRRDLPFDVTKDFAPVTRLATASNVLVVNNDLPVANVADLVRYAKSKPGTLNYASAGIGTPGHLAGEMLNLLAGIQVTHIPYKGAAPALLDVIAGNAQYIFTSPLAAGAHMNAGRVRAIATTGTERNPSLPTLPIVADTVPGYEITQSWGVAAPAGTPPDIVKRLNEAFVKAMASPEVKEKVLKTGAVPAGDSPAAFEAFMAAERARLGNVIKQSGIVLKD
ncbi:MAG: tripartite tricarboxylate transporter substrate binding protein [Betaproteobacteria bacterium PRO3]|nr:tripartite tricarboxylate transporter substrate binding protein [Betaproteobacteria bacterium PRO3]